eukprot:7075793-Prymnesium_polylepis.1
MCGRAAAVRCGLQLRLAIGWRRCGCAHGSTHTRPEAAAGWRQRAGARSQRCACCTACALPG